MTDDSEKGRVLSVGKVLGALYALFSLIIGAIYALIAIVIGLIGASTATNSGDKLIGGAGGVVFGRCASSCSRSSTG
jgi:hypothetical protein